ncbi:MAG: DUF1963 domain-containing protein [Ruminococcus sp.]|nr:DUF1963 domain-containing protein [Ruminococcus sp.]
MSETKQCMKLKLTNRKPSIFGSKIGGLGYLPHEMDVPTNKQGNQLRLLAQINCAEVDMDNFPKQGLLQFWILNDSLSGLDFDDNTNQNGFRIVYHPFIDETVTELELTFKVFGNPFDDESVFPVKGEFAVEMVKSEESADGYNDEDSPLSGHKIGGFPLLTKYDPRGKSDYHDFLLLQLDSDFESCFGEDGKYQFRENIMWGDAGTGFFFINREALKLLDFSDVLYHWDCT